MNFTVYRQAVAEREDGTKRYLGEDAKPFISDNLVMVVDGIGGDDAIVHRDINENLFDSALVADTLFDGVFEDTTPEFRQYVTDAFSELFAGKDDYLESVDNAKKSGYFASRLVSAIMMQLLREREDFAGGQIFADIAAMDEIDKNNKMIELGKYFADNIYDRLRRIAVNAGLKDESVLGGLLLGSALCAAIYYERDKDVDVIYLCSGSARPYSWKKKYGLVQLMLTADNSDVINAKKPFDLSCRFVTLAKPCMLLNATEGAYGAFLSEASLEHVLLTSVAETGDSDGMQYRLDRAFDGLNLKEDSASMAVKVFGYVDHAEFKVDAEYRLAELNDKFLSVHPEMLTRDFNAEIAETEESVRSQSDRIKALLIDEEDVLKYCSDEVKDGKWESYNEKIAEIDELIDECRKVAKPIRYKANVLIKQNFILFMAESEKDKFKQKNLAAKCRRTLKKIAKDGDISRIPDDGTPEMQRAMRRYHDMNMDESTEAQTRKMRNRFMQNVRLMDNVPMFEKDAAALEENLNFLRGQWLKRQDYENVDKAAALDKYKLEYFDEYADDIARLIVDGSALAVPDEKRAELEIILSETDFEQLVALKMSKKQTKLFAEYREKLNEMI